jgi:hypothetical protein
MGVNIFENRGSDLSAKSLRCLGALCVSAVSVLQAILPPRRRERGEYAEKNFK